ncbi:MAG: hypothetical protein H7831_04620 [Magnetococcus sp. WYHC-3]
MSDTQKEDRKELARMKRQVSELAGAIHDIVEETLWEQYQQLPDLSAKLVEGCRQAQQFEAERGLS